MTSADHLSLTDCTVCFENLRNETPTILSCQHIFCTKCIKRLMTPIDDYFSVNCPTCRKLTTFDSDEPLPCHFIINLLHDSTMAPSNHTKISATNGRRHDCSHCATNDTVVYCCQDCWRNSSSNERGLYCSDCCVLAHSGHKFLPLDAMGVQGSRQVDALKQGHAQIIEQMTGIRINFPIGDTYSRTNDDTYITVIERLNKLQSTILCCSRELCKFKKIIIKHEKTSKIVESFNILETLLEQGNAELQHCKSIVGVYESFLLHVTIERNSLLDKFKQMINDFERHQRSPVKRSYAQTSFANIETTPNDGPSTSRHMRIDRSPILSTLPTLSLTDHAISQRNNS